MTRPPPPRRSAAPRSPAPATGPIAPSLAALARRRRRRASTAADLRPEDWADAALVALGEGGVAAVAVEPLARALGVTKGSFYWHFADRSALLAAALARWERIATEQVIARVEAAAASAPGAGLEALLGEVFGNTGMRIEVAIAAAADDPVVGPVLARVARRRLEYTIAMYQRAGLPPAAARHRGLLAYSAYVGLLHVVRATPDVLASEAARKAYVAFLTDALGPPQGSGSARRGARARATARRSPSTSRRR